MRAAVPLDGRPGAVLACPGIRVSGRLSPLTSRAASCKGEDVA